MPTPLTMFHQARRPNGRMAIIAASATTIYRFYGLDNGPYWSENPADYVAPYSGAPLYVSENPADYIGFGGLPKYVEDLEGIWSVIGDGFFGDAQRWEALNINGWAVFNNGVDLPVTYRVEESTVVPIYELREQGVASVGCISELNGALFCCDIREIQPDALEALFLSGANHYARFTDNSLINRVTYRLINSVPNFPRRWAATVQGTILAYSRTLTLKYAIKSLTYGQQVIILGAGVDGGNLTAHVQNVSGTSVILQETASTTAIDAIVEALTDSGAIASDGTVGSYDLQDDSSGIVKAARLKDALVVFKDTAIFIGVYSGRPGALFEFKRKVPDTSQSVYYRNTLIAAVKDESLYYAGRNAFYAFDLVTQRPQEIPVLNLLSNLFFDQASVSDQNLIWAAENAITKEVWFVFPSTVDDKAICYDYFTNTCSTTGIEITAGLTIKKPIAGLASGPQEDWFIMGLPNGSVAQYGLTAAKPIPSGVITASQAGNTVTASAPIFTKDHINKSVYFANRMTVNILDWISTTQVTVGGAAQTVASQKFFIIPEVYARLNVGYKSILAGGLSPWGDQFREKDISSYVLTLSSFSPNCALLFEILGARNTAEGASLLGSKAIVAPIAANFVPMYFRQNYFQDRITIDGINNPCKLLSRTFGLAHIRSDSFIRRP